MLGALVTMIKGAESFMYYRNWYFLSCWNWSLKILSAFITETKKRSPFLLQRICLAPSTEKKRQALPDGRGDVFQGPIMVLHRTVEGEFGDESSSTEIKVILI